MDTSPLILLAAGGTGGHLFPAEALASELLGGGSRVHLLSDARAEAFAGRVGEIETHHVRAAQLGGGAAHTAHALGELALGTLQARRLLRRLSPACVIGFGGYASIPTMLAAVSLGLPTAIHEQNAVLGRANRLLAPRVRRIATGFPATAGLRPADGARTVQTGDPVRPAVLALARTKYKAPQRGSSIELLILGGSQGARIMSEAVPPALATLPTRLREMLRVSHQARPEDLPGAEAIYRKLAVIGRPAVLIPYPYATDNHQAANARAFADAGAGWVIAQPELRPDTFALYLENLLGDPAALTAAAQRAGDFGRPDAARDLAQLAIELGLGSRAQGRAA